MKKNFLTRISLWAMLGLAMAMWACVEEDADNEEATNGDGTEQEVEVPETYKKDMAYPVRQDGVLMRGRFKVGENKYVKFSQGNLQYSSSGTHETMDGTAAGTWRFSDLQYAAPTYSFQVEGNSITVTITDNNTTISNTESDKCISHFGWGASGWSGGVSGYQPWNYSSNEEDYYIDGVCSNDMLGKYRYADWGVYNAISNGGNTPDMWRTLTQDEWEYLIKNNRWTLANVGGVVLLLLPEGFTVPDGMKLSIASDDLTVVESKKIPQDYVVMNRIAISDFSLLEERGVVALACAGFMIADTDLDDYETPVLQNQAAFYWSSTADDRHADDPAYSLFYGGASGFALSATGTNYICSYGSGGADRNRWGSVRLVQDVKD